MTVLFLSVCSFERNGQALLVLLPSEEEHMVQELRDKKIPIQKIRCILIAFLCPLPTPPLQLFPPMSPVLHCSIHFSPLPAFLCFSEPLCVFLYLWGHLHYSLGQARARLDSTRLGSGWAQAGTVNSSVWNRIESKVFTLSSFQTWHLSAIWPEHNSLFC